jgi:hypothetical protein
VSSNTSAVALHGFVHSTSFGDMLLSCFTAGIAHRRAPRATLRPPSASRTFVRCPVVACPRGLRSFLGAGTFPTGRFPGATTATPPQGETLGQRGRTRL